MLTGTLCQLNKQSPGAKCDALKMGKVGFNVAEAKAALKEKGKAKAALKSKLKPKKGGR